MSGIGALSPLLETVTPVRDGRTLVADHIGQQDVEAKVRVAT
jgi:hypothetical protein